MIAYGDADARQGGDHVRRDGEIVFVHPELDVDDRNDRVEIGMRAEELVFRRRLADRNGDDAGARWP